MVDPEKKININDKSYLIPFREFYMKFYIYLKYLLTKYHLSNKVNLIFFFLVF